jgi:hypothetical protein
MADEKLDLDALEQECDPALALTMTEAYYQRKILAMIAHIRALESRAGNAGGAVALWQEKWAPSAELHIRDAIAGIGNCIADPMWADHAEVPKANLKKWHKALHGANDAMKSSREHGFRDCIDAIRGAIAFGSQNTNAPPDGHWLAEFWSIGRTQPAPASKEPVADERAAFEAAWQTRYPNHSRAAFMHSLVIPGMYANTRVNDGYAMWQARAALATAQTEQRETDYALAYKHGWINCAKWADRVDMISDIGSAAYDRDLAAAAERHGFLAAAPAKQEGGNV